MANLSCKSCVFFVGEATIGACRRYPENKNKHVNEWCGEFKEKIVEEVKQKLVEQAQVATCPVVAKIETKQKIAEPKKRGRNPKNG